MGEKGKHKKVKETTPKSTKYIVDVPNFDKDGNDVSGDKPVSGGRRRKDGTLETTTENYTLLSDYEEKLREEITREVNEQKLEKLVEAENDGDNSTKLDTIADTVEVVGDVFRLLMNIAEFLNNNPELVYKTAEGIGKTKATIKTFFNKISREINSKFIKDESHHDMAPVSQTELENKSGEIINDKCVNLTEEEARQIFIDMIKGYIVYRSNYEVLKSANLISSELSIEDIITKFNEFEALFPTFLEDGNKEQLRTLLQDLENENDRVKILQLIERN